MDIEQPNEALSCKWPKAVHKKKRRKLTSIWLLEAVRRILVFPCSFTCRNMTGKSGGQAGKIKNNKPGR